MPITGLGRNVSEIRAPQKFFPLIYADIVSKITRSVKGIR